MDVILPINNTNKGVILNTKHSKACKKYCA